MATPSAPSLAPEPSATTDIPTPEGPLASVEGITEYRLANGLKVLLYPDQSKPTVTVNITYFVGSRHEGYGESGMAHLLEHMLFKGTPTHRDVWKVLQDRGAQFNGTTWYDRTNYYEELPATSDNLEFALRLEADRMVNSFIAREDLTREFSVVRNEFEMGENNPAGVLEEKVFSAAYQWHNYGKSTIGSRSDIERVPIENLQAFYRRYYRPDNAMLVVAGKFDPQQALELVARTFGALPRPAEALPSTWTEEPVQDGERTVVLRRNGEVAVVAVAYHGVAGADPDWVASDALTDVLANKPAGRLYKGLVEKGLASEVFGYVYPTAEPGLVYFGAKVRPGGQPEKVRDELIKIIESLAKKPVTPVELERWRSRSLKEFELALTDTASVGVALSDWAAMGDWRLFFLTRDRLKGVQPADVTRVAANFLRTSNRTVGLFLPSKSLDRAPAPARIDVGDLMKDFKGSAELSEGEVFAATTENIEQRTRRVRLGHGLQAAFLPKKTKGGAVRVLINLRVGDERSLTGRSQAAASVPAMLMRGSKKHSFQQLKDRFDQLRAEVHFGSPSPGANSGLSRVRIKTVRENLSAVLSLVAEVLRQPAFPRAQFETLRKEMLARLEEQLSDPNHLGMNLLYQRLMPAARGDIRYLPSAREKIEDLKRLKVADVARVHAELWGASAAQMAVVGDFDADEIESQLARELASWRSPRPYGRVEQPFREGVAGEVVTRTPDKQMALVVVGHPIAVRDDDPDYPALVLLNHLLGGSATSRLLNRLRQKEGLSYGAFSEIDARPLDRSGLFYAGAICAPQNAEQAERSMLEEVERLRREPVPEDELADAKQSYAASFQTMLAEDDFVSDELAKGLFLERTMEHLERLNQRIQGVSAADLVDVASRYLQADKLTRIKAGDLPGGVPAVGPGGDKASRPGKMKARKPGGAGKANKAGRPGRAAQPSRPGKVGRTGKAAARRTPALKAPRGARADRPGAGPSGAPTPPRRARG